MSDHKLRVLSCVPPQYHTAERKLEWMEGEAQAHKPDLFVTPQEFFGGKQMMPQRPYFKKDELLPELSRMAEAYNMGIVAGVVEDDGGDIRQRLWFINEEGDLVGQIAKFALPGYTHIDAGGTYQVVPETELWKRSVTFEIKGAKIGGLFCWEAMSDFIWFALGIAEPDIVVSPIKFGVMAFPTLQGNKKEGRSIKDFRVLADEDTWVERLEIASRWEVNCPIIVSTNTWHLPPQSKPICGVINDYLNEGTMWCPEVIKVRPDDLSKVEVHRTQVDEIDINHVRGLRTNKWNYMKLNECWPPFEASKWNMLTKIKRIERRLVGAVTVNKDWTIDTIPASALGVNEDE